MRTYILTFCFVILQYTVLLKVVHNLRFHDLQTAQDT